MLWLQHRYLKSKDANERLRAVIALGRRADIKETQNFAKALLDADPDIRIAASDAMSVLRQTNAAGCIPMLTPWLEDENLSLRHCASEALELLGWIPSNSKEHVLNAIARANFSTIGPEEEAAAPCLLPLLKNPSESARVKAAETLERILARKTDAQVVDALIKALKDPELSVRFAALHALGNSSDERRTTYLIDMAKNESAHLRVTALEAIGKLGDPTLFRHVVVAAKDANYEVRLEAITTLGKIKNKEAVPLLIEMLQDNDTDVRKAAVESLSRLRDPRSVQPLVETLLDTESIVRHAVANALQILNFELHIAEEAKKTLPYFEANLNHDDYRIRDAAAKAITRVMNL